jgi:FAD/FMN-containing dehydrogenase
MEHKQRGQSNLSRRQFAQALAGGSLIAGGGGLTGAILSSAGAERGRNFDAMPPLTGTLYVDDATRDTYARDYGQIVHERPIAALQPGSVDDIVEILRFARRNGVRVAVRGQGHQPYGQAQVSGGVVIDMRSLSTVHSIANDQVDVEAGADWRKVLKATLSLQRTPPVLPNYLGLTVGGTLSIGGIGLATLHHGAQVDNVCELEVVTGEGNVVTCSPHQHSELFEAALAGQGQFAIITRAVLRLVPAASKVREYTWQYPDVATLLEDEHALQQDGRFDGAVGLVVRTPAGGWSYMLQAVRNFTPPDLPDDAALKRGLRPIAGSEQTRDADYLEYADAAIPPETPGGHADLGLIVPGHAAAGYLADVLPRLTDRDLGGAVAMRVFVWNRKRFTRPLFRVPEADTCVYVAMLRAPATDQEAVARVLAGNRALFERNRSLGGTLYAFAALDLSRSDWRQHYAESWSSSIALKRRHDPDNLFASGPDVLASAHG